MPKKAERKLKATAKKKFPGNKKRQDKYVYGALRKMGWKPSHQRGNSKINGISFKKVEHCSASG